MERKKDVNNDEIRWKKIGGGSLRFKGRIIKPGQVFRAKADEIPQSFRDVVVPLQEIPGQKSPAPPEHEVVEPVYTAKPRGGGQWQEY